LRRIHELGMGEQELHDEVPGMHRRRHIPPLGLLQAARFNVHCGASFHCQAANGTILSLPASGLMAKKAWASFSITAARYFDRMIFSEVPPASAVFSNP